MASFNAYSTAENLRLTALLKSISDNGMIPQIITKDDGTESYKIFQKPIPYEPREKNTGILNRGIKVVLKAFGRGKNEGIKISKESEVTGQLQEVGEIYIKSNGEVNPYGSPIEGFKASGGLRKGLNENILENVIKSAEDMPFAPAFTNDEKKYIRNFFSNATLIGQQVLLQDTDGSITNFKGVNSDLILSSILDRTQRVILADATGLRVGSVDLVAQGPNGNPNDLFRVMEENEDFYRGVIKQMVVEAKEDAREREEETRRERGGYNEEEGIVRKDELEAGKALGEDAELDGFDDDIADAIKLANENEQEGDVKKQADFAGVLRG